VSDLSPGAAGPPMAGGVDLEICKRREPVVDTEEVGHVADQLAHRVWVLRDRDPADGGGAGVGESQRGQDANRGRLPSAVGTDESEYLAGRDGGVHGLERHLGPEALGGAP